MPTFRWQPSPGGSGTGGARKTSSVVSPPRRAPQCPLSVCSTESDLTSDKHSCLLPLARRASGDPPAGIFKIYILKNSVLMTVPPDRAQGRHNVLHCNRDRPRITSSNSKRVCRASTRRASPHRYPPPGDGVRARSAVEPASSAWHDGSAAARSGPHLIMLTQQPRTRKQ